MSNQVQTERAAGNVDKATREMQVRLAELHAAHPAMKLQKAPIVVAAFFEVLQHQARFNACAIAELAELRTRLGAVHTITDEQRDGR